MWVCLRALIKAQWLSLSLAYTPVPGAPSAAASLCSSATQNLKDRSAGPVRGFKSQLGLKIHALTVYMDVCVWDILLFHPGSTDSTERLRATHTLYCTPRVSDESRSMIPTLTGGQQAVPVSNQHSWEWKVILKPHFTFHLKMSTGIIKDPWKLFCIT